MEETLQIVENNTILCINNITTIDKIEIAT